MAQTLETIISINARTGNGFLRVGSTLMEMGALVDGLSQKLISFGEDSIAVYRDYEKSMSDAEVALSTTYGRGTKELQTTMSGLDAAATEWAANSIFHTNDVANAISEAAHAGWDYERIMAGIPAAMQLAQAGGLDLSEAVNYIVKSTNAAGIGFEDMGHFIDLWAFAANSSASTIEEFGDAMLRMGSTMRFSGNTEELMTLIAVTANAGSTGSEAGTMIRNSIMRLIAPTDKAKEAMALLGATSEETAGLLDDQSLAAANAELAARGFSAFDEHGNLKNILDIYRELYLALGDVAGGFENIDQNQDALQILSTIFPTRTITEALTLLRGAAEGYDGLYESMMNGDAEGYGEYAAETQMDTLYGRIETFYSKVERLKQLVGEELSGQVGSVLEGLGGIVDSIAGLDEGKFEILVSGMEALALAGPGLVTLGTGARLIGHLITPSGLAAASVFALATGLTMLDKASEVEFEGKFGNLELDLTTLKQNVDSLTTDAEQQAAQIGEYTTQIASLAEQYHTTVSNFAAELSTNVLTGKVLTESEKKSLLEYGQSITDTILQGISTRRDSSLTFLNSITPDDMSEEEYGTYSGLFDGLTGYFSGLEAQAQEIGTNLQQAILDGLQDDGKLDETEQSIVQTYADMLNRIEAEIAAQVSQADFYAQLEKAGRISKDSLDEYMDYLARNHSERVEEMNSLYDREMGTARAAYESELGHALTDEQWEATDRYRYYEGRRQEGVGQIDAQTAELARTAFGSLMQSSDMGNTWDFLQRIMREVPRNEEGEAQYESIDWEKYLSQGAVPDTFMQDLESLQKPEHIFGIGGSELGNMIKEWANVPGMSDLYNLFSGENGILNTEISAQNYQSSLGGWTNTGKLGDYYDAEGMLQSKQGTFDITANVDDSQLEAALQTAEQGTELGVDTVVDRSAFDEIMGTTVPVQIMPYTDGTDSMTALQDQGVQVQVDGDTQQLQATIDGADGQNLLEYVDGDATNLEMEIRSQDGKTLYEYVTGNTASLAAAIESYNGRTIVVNIVGQKLFAAGGRATTASIFGEGGPEWAIPEEHSERTASLLNAARAASGFTWPELLSRFGGLNADASNKPATIIYSPVIHAQDASGVESALIADKKRLERWWREHEMRDRMEVYQ